MARYKWDDRLKTFRETAIPPESLYVPIGFDGTVSEQNPTNAQRHYRKFYTDELENNKQIFHKRTFHNIDIINGVAKKKAKGGLFDLGMFGIGDGDSGQMDQKKVGMFKAHIRVYNDDEAEIESLKRVQSLQNILQLINDINFKKFGKKLEMDLSNITSSEDK